MAGTSSRTRAFPRARILILDALAGLFRSWVAEVSTLAWLGLALIAAIVEVSVPHFGFAFVSLGAVAAAVAAYFGASVIVQIGLFVVVLAVSLIALRSRLLVFLAGHGVPSRTQPLIGRHGVVTTDIDSIVGGGRVNVGGEDWAARAAERIPSGVKVRVVGADGIVLEVTRE
jgi:membrane protein implicated in regulation of membrane protease activity